MIDSYDMAIKLDPNDALSFNYRGGTYDAIGDCKNAIESYVWQ